jgi:hypothetical protein
MNPVFLILALLLLAACASPKPEPITRRAEPVARPMEILIETYPPGGIVDWNGNVIGAAPVTLTITPQLTNYGRPRWPETGANAHIFRARWRNGDRAAELFMADEMPPQRIAIISPVQEIWGMPVKKTPENPAKKFP